MTVSNGDDGRIILYCHAGCKIDDIIRTIGLKWSDIQPSKETNNTNKNCFDWKHIVAKYNYPNGTRKLRDQNKNFCWQHLTEDGWKAGRPKNIPHILYEAGNPQETVFVVEGEKDADNLSKLGFFCVSAENGASEEIKDGGKWFKSYTERLTEKSVIIIPDNDDVGKSFMDSVASELKPVVSSLKVLDLKKIFPEIEDHGDISDMIFAYGQERTKSLLLDLINVTDEWVPFEVAETDVFSEFGFYSVTDLTDEEKKPPEFIIDGMLPCGMTFLSGAPKIRKSFLALQMAIAVATGTPFFGHSTHRCSVAYLDLEGSKSRISARTKQMTTAIPSTVYITNRISERLANGLTEKLQALHKQKPDIRLIIIDTYSRARGQPKTAGLNAYDLDVQLLEPIQQMALQENIAILFVHHDKKGAGFASDSFERLSGTMGISGSSDCVMNLIADGKRFDGKATLEFTPRDAKGGELKLEFIDRFNEWQAFEEAKNDIDGNPVCSWIISNAFESALPKREGAFFSYDLIFSEAYHTYSSNSGDVVRKQIELYRDQLFSEYNLGIQCGCRSNGKRGVRVINLV